MQDKTVQLREINYSRLFPWLNLFRGFRIAVDLRKLILASVALLLMAAGDRIIGSLPFAPESAENLQVVPTDWWSQETTLQEKAEFIFKPLLHIGRNLFGLLNLNKSWSDVAFLWIQILWALIVWSIFGGAIARIAAVQFARDENIGMVAALKFSLSRILGIFSAPLFSAVAVGGLWLVGVVFGMIGNIPYLGDAIVGILWIVPLLLGFLAMFVLLGLAGWPLMTATIGVEDSDAFDGFSRTYSYIFGRPWSFAWQLLVALGFGIVAVAIVSLFAKGIVYLAAFSVGGGMGIEKLSALLRESPVSAQLLNSAEPITLGMRAATMWMHVVALLISGFASSYFWTAYTIIYFLLRQRDDGVELNEVYIRPEDADDDILPLVGMAASDQPLAERSIEKPAEASAANSSEAKSESELAQKSNGESAIPDNQDDEGDHSDEK